MSGPHDLCTSNLFRIDKVSRSVTVTVSSVGMSLRGLGMIDIWFDVISWRDCAAKKLLSNVAFCSFSVTVSPLGSSRGGMIRSFRLPMVVIKI